MIENKGGRLITQTEHRVAVEAGKEQPLPELLEIFNKNGIKLLIELKNELDKSQSGQLDLNVIGEKLVPLSEFLSANNGLYSPDNYRTGTGTAIGPNKTPEDHARINNITIVLGRLYDLCTISSNIRRDFRHDIAVFKHLRATVESLIEKWPNFYTVMRKILNKDEAVPSTPKKTTNRDHEQLTRSDDPKNNGPILSPEEKLNF